MKHGPSPAEGDANARPLPFGYLRAQVLERRLNIAPLDAAADWVGLNCSQRLLVRCHTSNSIIV